MSERAPALPLDQPRPSPRRRRLIFAGLAVVLPVVAAASIAGVAVAALGWSAFSQASGTMRPGLLLDDYFFVDTRAYRDGRGPDYGDIVAVSVPAALAGIGTGPNVTLVNRVVGRPGDQIGIAAGIVSVNGRALPQEPLGELADGRPGRHPGKVAWLRERAANGASYEILRQAGPGEGGSYAVPQGHYFVMGDNRDDSLDSRFWVQRGGWYLPAGNILGRATYIYWSGFDRLDRIGTAPK